MFDDFLKELAKPSWWIGVVVVGFLINLASAYTKPLLDKLLGRFWLSSKQAAERHQAFITQRAKELLSDPQLVVEVKIDILTDTLHAVLMILSAIICFFMIVLDQNDAVAPIIAFPFKPKSVASNALDSFFLLSGGVLLSLSLGIFLKSFDKERVLFAYRKLKKEVELIKTL